MDTTMSTDAASPAVRATRQRAAVRTELDRVDAFRSAQEIHADLASQGTAIGLSTVYRALQALVSTGDVDVIARSDGESAYRACGERHHHHLVCRDCGRTQEVEGEAVEVWAQAIARRHGYRDVTHVVEVFGTCRECRG